MDLTIFKTAAGFLSILVEFDSHSLLPLFFSVISAALIAPVMQGSEETATGILRAADSASIIPVMRTTPLVNTILPAGILPTIAAMRRATDWQTPAMMFSGFSPEKKNWGKNWGQA